MREQGTTIRKEMYSQLWLQVSVNQMRMKMSVVVSSQTFLKQNVLDLVRKYSKYVNHRGGETTNLLKKYMPEKISREDSNEIQKRKYAYWVFL